MRTGPAANPAPPHGLNAALLLALGACAAPAPAPQTTPEATQHARTSSHAEVAAFVDALRALPHGDRLQVGSMGRSHEGRDLFLVRAALPKTNEPEALRALVVANIHAGEVEGKEAVQQMLREIALGEHEDLLERFVLYFVPVYNADGNERLAAKNRPEQNGPVVVGERANAQGLDLNRDFVKAEAPETRALLGAFARLDPHVFFDLHTTDGSWHGYDLTYAPSLAPNCDASVATLSRHLLDDATSSLLQATPPIPTFDYGNFETRDWDGGGAPSSRDDVRGWWTYDHRARYGVNYFGLRNRIGVLSEAYSNADFASRIRATHAFVLAVLRAAAEREPTLREAFAAADARLDGEPGPDSPAPDFAFATTFAAPETLDVRVGDCERIALPDGLGIRFARKPQVHIERMPVFRTFEGRQRIALPLAWAIPSPPPGTEAMLRLHDVRCEVLEAPRRVEASRFAVTQKRKPKRPFQGHQELVLEGTHGESRLVDLPAGTLWVEARQPRARIAATLLEAQSEDSLSTWNRFEDVTAEHYPVLRVGQTATNLR